MIQHGWAWSYIVLRDGEWSCMVPHGCGDIQSRISVLTTRSRAGCQGHKDATSSPAPGCSVMNDQIEPWLSMEFTWSQGWELIKGKLHLLQSKPGLIYVYLEDAN